jgi:endo-1,4-beta-D-glucanase Y
VRTFLSALTLVAVYTSLPGCSQRAEPPGATGGTTALGGSNASGASGASSGGLNSSGGASGGSSNSGGVGNPTGGSGAGSPAAGGMSSGGMGAGGSAGSASGGPAMGGQASGGMTTGGTAGAGGAGGGNAGAAGATGGGAAGAKGLGACVLPAGANFADVQANYQKWKTDLLTSEGAGGFLRVRRPNSGTQINSSNSEGIAYGMTIAVYMDDQTTFDQLWKYEQIHRGANGLMEWEIGPTGSVLGSGAASDGDEDMAFALVMADKKWGGKGTLADTYLNYAKKQIDLIWQFEVDHGRNDVLTPGDNFTSGAVINISYFAPAYYRIFGQVSGKVAEWNRVAKTSYDVLEATLNATNKNATNGLVPAWSTPAGAPMVPPGTSHPLHHQLDSCRTPFRIAQDYCWFNEPRALSYLQKINAFHANIGAANIVDGYNLDGSVFPGSTLHLAAFVGGAGVGAMATPQHAALRDESYTLLAGWQALLGGSTYYNESWSMLSLLMLTGRFVDLTQQ